MRFINPETGETMSQEEYIEGVRSWLNDVMNFVENLRFCLDCNLAVTPVDGKCPECHGSNFAEEDE